MKLVKFWQIILILLLFCMSCMSNSNSSFYFTGDGTELLIERSDLPSQWQLESTGEQPLRGGKGWVRIFSNSDTHDRGLISNGVTVFDREQDAIEYWNEFIKTERDFPRPPCVNPPNEYTSEVADQFEMFCADSDGFVGVFAYEYSIVARYGNVVFSLRAVAINEPDITVSQASEAGVLRWTEMEALLKRADEKFEQVSLSTQ